jgi:drug/metabolite transporter (DMT)-like permease
MIFWIALLAAFGCALCNGTAAILQKMSVDKEDRIQSVEAGMLLHLLRDWPYLLGGILDGVAWLLTLVAVHNLPLFVVQPIIAFSIVVTLLIERIFFHRKIPLDVSAAIGCIAFGLVLLALSSAPETASATSHHIRLAIILCPLALAASGAVAVRSNSRLSTALLAAISGLAFGGTSIVGRLLVLSRPYWHTAINPLFLALIGYGVVGIVFFTIALQRSHASVINAIMVAFETIVPICVGLFVLGDRPKPGLAIVMLIGAVVAVGGILLIARRSSAGNQLGRPIEDYS